MGKRDWYTWGVLDKSRTDGAECHRKMVNGGKVMDAIKFLVNGGKVMDVIKFLVMLKFAT